MGVGRALYVLFFPLVFTLLGLVLSVVTFFSGYKDATGLRNIHFMSLDLADLNIGGQSLTQLLSKNSIHPVYTVAVNGWCYGSKLGNVTTCETPHEPFYFNFEEILDVAGFSSLMNSLPSSVHDYSTASKAATYAVWVCFLATIVLAFFQLFFGVFTMCSHVCGRFAEFFATLAFIASILGSGIATGVYSIYTRKINEAGGDFGIKASLDNSGLGCAWATVAALLVADILYVIASCCCASTRTKYVTVPEKVDYAY